MSRICYFHVRNIRRLYGVTSHTNIMVMMNYFAYADNMSRAIKPYLSSAWNNSLILDLGLFNVQGVRYQKVSSAAG
jgi:hypothetical protein